LNLQALVDIYIFSIQTVYESFVMPRNPVTNYLTQYSGITEKILKDVTTTLEDVQEALEKLLPSDAIIVGHSLNFDLAAMKVFNSSTENRELIDHCFQ
jgi:RNA exonuclease 1